ncbi:MAG: SDR family oxidoreductase [Myxococcota bacterium]
MAARQWVIVTGASTGIGRACALRLAARGTHVLAGVRKPADGERLVEAADGHLTPLIVDVAHDDSIAAAAVEIEKHVGDDALVGLVNNAGIAVGGLQETMPRAQWQRQFDVNVLGVTEMTRTVLPHLLASRGRVVNISSAGGRVASPFLGPYHASKFALEAITDGLRMELRPFGVWAACVEPGAVKTEIWGKGNALIRELSETLPPETLARYEAGLASVEAFTRSAAQRGVAPDAVAKKVEHALFASRPKTRYLVGTDAHIMVFMKWLLPDRWFEAAAAALVSRG